MARQIMSRRKAHALSFALFLIGLAILALTKSWWPSIMLVIGVPISLRQYLLGKIYDMSITLFVCVGTYITVQFNIKWDILLPVLFTLGGIYVFAREFFNLKETSEEESEENLNKELEEDKEKKKK